jgi:hypothetical protein
MVKFDGIKGKIFLTLLLPAWTAILILITVSFFPIHNICHDQISDIYSGLIDRNNQIGYKIQQFRIDYLNVLKNAEADLLVVVNSTLNTYFNNSSAFKSDFKVTTMTHNAVEINQENEQARDWNSSCNCSYTDAEWYISPYETTYDNLTQLAKDDIRLASTMHSIMRPFLKWVDFMNGYIWIFEESGVFYISPVRKYDFFGNYTEPDSCIYDRSHFEPRCKTWHSFTKNSKHDIVLIWPDFYEEFDIMGEFICLKVLKNSKFYASVCLQPRLKYFEHPDNYILGDCSFQVYITRPDGYVISKPNMWTRDYKPCVLDLEFGKESSSERTFFEKVYKSRFYNREKGNGIYATDSSTKIIFHSPINLTLKNIESYNEYFYGAVLFTNEVDDVLNYTIELKFLYLALLKYEGLFWTFILILALMMYWM